MTDIDYPFHFTSQGRTAVCGKEDHIREMIEEFIFSSPGERVNRPDFGSGAIQMVFAPNSPEIAAALKHLIQAGLLQYLGDLIEIQALDVENADTELTIQVKYTIRATGEQCTETYTRRCS